MIGIVTVLYNSSKVLGDYFKSLERQTYKDFVLYVIDNNSSDNSLKIIKELMKIVSFNTVLLPQKENFGVAKGNNIGILKALSDNCDYVLLSNNDVVLEPDCIYNLLTGHISMKASLSIPKIYYYNTDRIIWCVGGHFRICKCDTPHRGRLEHDDGQYESNCYTRYAPTCFMLIQKDVFKRVGLMDINYFVYYDDADFVWRALKKNNEKLAYISTSVLWHKESYCTGGGQGDFYIHYFYRNRVFFALKHFNLIQKIVFFSYLFLHYVTKSKVTFNKEQRLLYKNSCIEGWRLHRMIKKKDNSYKKIKETNFM